MQMLYTQNKTTNEFRYYIDGKRVSKDKFTYTEILAGIQGKTMNSLFTTSSKNTWKHYASIS